MKKKMSKEEYFKMVLANGWSVEVAEEGWLKRQHPACPTCNGTGIKPKK